jgi:hypothetical protein
VEALIAIGSDPQPPPAPSGDFYPVDLWLVRPDTQSRLTNFPFLGWIIRSLLLIPHVVILYFFQIAAGIIFLIATFAILFTGKYPRGMFDFYVGYLRWSERVSGYAFHLYDSYPPFSPDDDATFALRLGVQYPEHSSRILNFPIFGLIIKAILLIPNLIALYFLSLVAFLLVILATFAILFTGRFPAGLHQFVGGTLRWTLRLNAYMVGLTDRYPPFSLT